MTILGGDDEISHPSLELRHSHGERRRCYRSRPEIVGLIHAAGVSPSQASPDAILHVDLYGTAVWLEEFGKVMARGGSGVVISS